MSESREQILADFQACTGLENMEECIHCLDQYDWNLMKAVEAVNQTIGSSGTDDLSPQRVGKATATSTSSTSATRKIPSSDDDDDEPKVIKTYTNNSTARRSTAEKTSLRPNKTTPTSGTSLKTRSSDDRIRELNFNVEYRDATERITASEQDTILQLKEKIAKKFNVPTNRQHFVDWKHRQNDNTHLKDLSLPKHNDIHLVSSTPSSSGHNLRTASTITQTNSRHDNHASASSFNYDFPITVRCEDKFGRQIPYELCLLDNTTIAEIKKQVERLTQLPVKSQEWKGLNGCKDSDTLNSSGIQPKATLSVRRAPIPLVKLDSKNSNHSDDEQSVMEIDDDDNTGFDEASFTSKREPLIPDRCTNESAGLENFIRIFPKRFSASGPILYIGSLESAIQGSLHSPIKHRRPLAIYLHHDDSICANVFCSQVLCSDTIVEYLANNYVLWAWDLTFDSNRIKLIELLKSHVGTTCALRVQSMNKESFPLILIITRHRGNMELINIIEGNTTPDEVLNNLIQSYETFDEQLRRDEVEETLRETRENLKRQQEEEYKASLAADVAKQKQRMEDEKKVKEQEHAEENQKKQRLAMQKECQAKLTAEPLDSDKDITTLKIRLPDNQGILMRRFRIKDTLQTLFDYLTSEGRMFGEYKLLSIHPRRDLTALNKSDTLEKLKLYPQEQLILEAL